MAFKFTDPHSEGFQLGYELRMAKMLSLKSFSGRSF